MAGTTLRAGDCWTCDRSRPPIPIGSPPESCKTQEPTREWLRCFRKNRQQNKPCPDWRRE
jgi:hypothetical protein